MKEKIVLVGGGGHCKSCIDVIEQVENFQIAGIVDVPDKLHQKLLGYEIMATDDDRPNLYNQKKIFLVTFGKKKPPDKIIIILHI